MARLSDGDGWTGNTHFCYWQCRIGVVGARGPLRRGHGVEGGGTGPEPVLQL